MKKVLKVLRVISCFFSVIFLLGGAFLGYKAISYYRDNNQAPLEEVSNIIDNRLPQDFENPIQRKERLDENKKQIIENKQEMERKAAEFKNNSARHNPQR